MNFVLTTGYFPPGKLWQMGSEREADLMDSLLLPKLSDWCSSGTSNSVPMDFNDWNCGFHAVARSPVTFRQCISVHFTSAWWCPLMARWYTGHVCSKNTAHCRLHDRGGRDANAIIMDKQMNFIFPLLSICERNALKMQTKLTLMM